MRSHEYNYAVFNLQAAMGKLTEFQADPPHVGRQSPYSPPADAESAPPE